MSKFVVDASVAIKWVLPEIHSDIAGSPVLVVISKAYRGEGESMSAPTMTDFFTM